MDFEYSDKVKALQQRLSAFMDEYVYPNEKTFYQQIEQGDRWQPTAIIEELKPKARAAGLWNLFLPENPFGEGLDESRIRAAVRNHGPFADGARSIQLLGAGHRQHGSAGALRQPRAKRALAEAAARRRNSLVLRDDRAGGCVVGRD